MLDSDSIQLLQGFAFGLAQNFFASALVEGKKLRDEKGGNDKLAFLERHEHLKQLEDRVGQAVCAAFRNLTLTQEEFQLLLPLASDTVFGRELAKQILSDTYSPDDVAKLVVRCVPSTELFGDKLESLAALLVAAIQSTIADDPHLHRTKELQFQAHITADVAEVKAEHSKTQETVRGTGQVVIDAVGSQLQDILMAVKALSDKTAEPDLREKIYHDRVEQTRKLMKSGKPKTARRLLEALRAEISTQNPSKALLFRIATNIGSCAIQLDDQQTALREIELAFQLDPENPKAIINLSATALLKGHPVEALRMAERARQLVPEDSIATANYIHALFALGREAELEGLIEREGWIKRDVNSCFVIGTLFFNRGRFADAEKYTRLGLIADSTEPHLLANLAHSLVRPVQTALLGEPILNWKFPADATPKLKEAEDLLGRAIALQDGFEDRRFVAFAYVLRADVRRMLGNEASAIADCEVALHEYPSDESALPIKALAHLHAHQIDEAISTFERITDNEAKKRILIPWAATYNATNKAAKAVNLLMPYWDALTNDPGQIKIADQLLQAYSQLGNGIAADEVIDKLKSAWPKAPEVLSAIAHYRKLQGRVDEAVGLYSEALTYASGPKRDFIALELADIFYERDEYSKAAELYEAVADLMTNNDLSRRYLLCLYYSGPHKEALKLAETLRGKGDPIPMVSQIEANILAEIGDLNTAQQIMERLSTINPKHHTCRIAAAQFALRRGRHAEARVLLENTPFEEIKTIGNLLLQVAQLRAVLGMRDVLKHVYQARRVGFTSSHIHAAYVWLFVSREQLDSVELTKETVDGDCGVILQVENGRRNYIIHSENDLNSERGEISLDQARAMHLVGRRKGERFNIGKDVFGNDIECTLIDVQSKYVRAFQETLEKFPALFPNDRTLQGIHGPFEKLRDGLFRHLDEQQMAFRQIANIYEARQITFEAFAGALHSSPIELWGMLTGRRYCPLANLSGTSADFEAEAATASKTDVVLLELTAILTFGQLGLLERLAKRYRLVTTQPVFDALTEAFAKVTLSKPGLNVYKEGNSYIRRETTAEEYVAQKDLLEYILQFLSKCVDTLPVPSLLEKDVATDGLRDFLGPISMSSIFATRVSKMPLYSEDQMLRSLASNEWNISGVSAQSVLHELVSKNIISKEECAEATARLFYMNFRVVKISADCLMWTLDKVQHQLTDEVTKMLAVFHGPQCTFESAVEVLSETIKRLWIDNSLYHQKVDLLDAILDALGTNRPTKQVAQNFTLAITLKLFLVPKAVKAISDRVRLWKERKLGRTGIIVTVI